MPIINFLEKVLEIPKTYYTQDEEEVRFEVVKAWENEELLAKSVYAI